MSAALPGIQGGGADLAWLKPPILNPTTRVALVAEPGAAEPAAGRLAARGYKAEGPATQILHLGF